MNNDLTAREWGLSLTPPIKLSRVLKLINEGRNDGGDGRVKGAYMRAGIWWIPKGAPDPRRPTGKAGHEAYYRKKRREANAGGAEA